MSARSREVNTELWMIPYADLMTILMILFLALFAYSFNNSQEVEKSLRVVEQALAAPEHAQAAAANLREAELALDIKDMIEGLALKDFGLQITSHYIHITLPNPVLFRLGSADLTTTSEIILRPLSRVLQKFPNEVIVKGHTDNLAIVGGDIKTNWELSAARSFSVIRYFVERGLEPGRLSARGYGEYRPVADNATTEGRRRNRRIEITIVRGISK